MIDTVIFDLDGTLVYTAPMHRYMTVGTTLKDLGRCAAEKDIDCFWFETRRDKIISDIFKCDIQEFWKAFRKHDSIESRAEYTKAYDDTYMLNYLKCNGYKTGIVTGAPKHIANFEISLLGTHKFDNIVIAHTDNGCRPKPDPQGIEDCMKYMGARKENTLYIGNSDEDILCAKAAGVYDIMIMRGEHEFNEAAPSMKIDTLCALSGILKRYNPQKIASA